MIYLFKIFNELNQLNSKDNKKNLTFKINDSNDAWLIADLLVAKELFRKYECNVRIAPMVNFQQDIKQVNLDQISNFFQYSPYLKNNLDHSEMRRVFSNFYSKLESSPKIRWDKNAQVSFLKSFDNKKSIFQSCRLYVLNYLLFMLDDYFGYKFSSINVNENFSLFDFYATKKQLSNLQNFISQLNEYLEFQNNLLLNNNKWNIISLFVMGYEALSVSIFFAIKEDILHYEKNDIFKKSSAISLLGTRIVTKNFKINDIKFKKNDEIFISPYLINQTSVQNHSFGMGSHSCLGKKLSLLIVDNFKNVYADKINSTLKIRNLRNFILRYEN